MKIVGNIGVDVAKIYNKNKNLTVHDKEKVDKEYDTLEISKEGREIARYVKMAKDLPEIRTQKVEDIKRKVQSGKYHVSPEDLAKKILESIKGENI